MAAHVVVIDSTARRATVKVTPTKHLSDVLEEACAKLGLNASQYGLKNNKKQLDLSLTFRLSGLSSGAKLELIQASRSPSVVSVALQLPESKAQGLPNARLTDKFPSSTTLWLILRKFEAGVAGGGGPSRNFTARGVPATNAGDSGAGRLYYQTPVINVMGRDLSSFTDLQKTLGQLGFNSGTTLLRLSFRATETPLEEAMAQIEAYFASVHEPEPVPNVAEAASAPASGAPTTQLAEATPAAAPTADTVLSSDKPEPTTSNLPSKSSLSVSSRPVQIFAPPTNTTPLSALRPHNESDYIPTIEHAKSHQRQLSEKSRPATLPSDAQLAAQAAATQAKVESISSVDVKVRFPDQSQVVSKFGQQDTGSSLYNFVRECLDQRWHTENFNLSIFTPGVKGQALIPNSDARRLIRDVSMIGRVLVNFSWAETASVPAQQTSEVLKLDLRRQAQQIKVEEIKGADDEEANAAPAQPTTKESSTEEKPKKSGGVPKWLKLPGKK